MMVIALITWLQYFEEEWGQDYDISKYVKGKLDPTC